MSEFESQFDPSRFLDATITEPNATSRLNCPPGVWPATIDGTPELNGGISQKEGPNEGMPWLRLDLKWRIEHPDVVAATGMPYVTVRQGIMLELTEGGAVDTRKGHNAQLGRLREALDLNQKGQPFSFRMLEGRSALISVAHRTYEGQIYDDVKKVARLAH